jgi:hypothetical protein
MPQIVKDNINSKAIRLYRYLNADAALKTIESRSFRVGRIHELNDPFEWRMGITGIIPEGQMFAQSLLDGFIAEISHSMGILSFSDTLEDAVLWSHYADKHRGVAFEVDHVINPDKLFKMVYTNERPVFDANRLHDQPEALDGYLKPLVIKLIKQKSPGWTYEREYRVFIDLPSCEISRGHYFRPIPDDYLKRVILGFKCPLETSYVMQSLAARGLKTTQVVRARMCLETYSIRC